MHTPFYNLISWVVPGLLMASAGLAQADQVFLYLPGIPGESVQAQHTNWIECSSATFGVSAAAHVFDGFTLESVVVSKTPDRSSPLLHAQVCDGSPLPGMMLDVVRTGETGPFSLRLVCSNVVVKTIDAAIGPYSQERASLAFDLVQWFYPTTQETIANYADQSVNRAGGVDDDTDGDGIPDIVDPDDDGDGFPDWKEFIAGTDPTDPASFLQILEIISGGEGDIIQWTSAELKVYKIEVSTNLFMPFELLTAGVLGAGPVTTYTNQRDIGRAAYYRVGVEH